MQLKMQNLKCLIPLVTTSVMLVGCSSSTDDTAQADKGKVPDTTTVVDKPIPMVVPAPAAPAASTLTLAFAPTKTFRFSWVAVTGATSYKLQEAITTGSGYELVKETTATSFDHIVPLYARVNSKYILQSCNAVGCTASAEVFTSAIVADMVKSIGYFKAGNTDAGDKFGTSVSLSADGNTLVVGAHTEGGSSQVINGENNNGAGNAGAVYVFTRDNNSAVWSQQAYLKASNADTGDYFGISVSLSADGNTLAVGAVGESSDGSGPDNGGVTSAGAAYVFIRTGEKWSPQDYLKANNVGEFDSFGGNVRLSSDGNTLAVSASGEDSNETGVGGNGGNDSAENAGAVYVFTRSDALWSNQPTYLKASNTGEYDNFGSSLSLSADGNTLAVGALNEDSIVKGLNKTGTDDNAENAGAVYVFTRSGALWSNQPTYLKPSNTGEGDKFGASVSLSADGNTLAVGAYGEKSNAKEINGDKNNDDAANAGAAYVFTRDTSATTAVWSEQAYLKANNTEPEDNFGFSVSLSDDGNILAVSALNEAGNEDGIGINGDEGNGSSRSGAAYTFTRSGENWTKQAYLKAGNTGENDQFGNSVTLSSDGGTLAVGAHLEDSNAKDLNGDQENGGATDSGAVYVY